MARVSGSFLLLLVHVLYMARVGGSCNPYPTRYHKITLPMSCLLHTVSFTLLTPLYFVPWLVQAAPPFILCSTVFFFFVVIPSIFLALLFLLLPP